MVRSRRLMTAALAAICLIVGIAIGLAIPRAGSSPAPDATAHLDRSPAPARFRNVYSPDIRHDPYVREEQLKMIRMLEQQCRVAPEYCEVARASRRALPKD